MSASYEIFDPLMDNAQAERMLRLCETYESYGSYAEEATNEVKLAPDLPQRFDAAANFLRTGGRLGHRGEPAMLIARTNYFRETYAYDRSDVPGVEAFLHHPAFIEAAKRVHGRRLIVPNIVYANILVPGQELAVHTDVPEFRGANRKRFPQWLLVVMQHSGLFTPWRIPMATGVAYFNACEGGAFAFYPDGPDGPPRALPVKPNTAVLLDTDSVFHGVDRVAETQSLPQLRPGMKLRFNDGQWGVFDAGKRLATYRWNEVRFSVSWKAYCYADEADRRRTETHEDDLELDFIVERLLSELRSRGTLEHDKPLDEYTLAQTLVREFIHFPPATTQSPKTAPWGHETQPRP